MSFRHCDDCTFVPNHRLIVFGSKPKSVTLAGRIGWMVFSFVNPLYGLLERFGKL